MKALPQPKLSQIIWSARSANFSRGTVFGALGKALCGSVSGGNERERKLNASPALFLASNRPLPSSDHKSSTDRDNTLDTVCRTGTVRYERRRSRCARPDARIWQVPIFVQRYIQSRKEAIDFCAIWARASEEKVRTSPLRIAVNLSCSHKITPAIGGQESSSSIIASSIFRNGQPTASWLAIYILHLMA